MCLSFSTEYLHLVLIETFVRAELQLSRSIAEIDVAYSVPNTFAKVARLGTFERCPSPEKKAVFRAEHRSLLSNNFSWLSTDVLVTPRTVIFLNERKKNSNQCCSKQGPLVWWKSIELQNCAFDGQCRAIKRNSIVFKLITSKTRNKFAKRDSHQHGNTNLSITRSSIKMTSLSAEVSKFQNDWQLSDFN